MPNQPKTPTRTFRVPDDEYEEARLAAEFNGESLTDIVRKRFVSYAKATQKKPGYDDWLKTRETK